MLHRITIKCIDIQLAASDNFSQNYSVVHSINLSSDMNFSTISHLVPSLTKAQKDLLIFKAVLNLLTKLY